ncbi:MAG TPA: hypothetical protein VF932_09675 [Anaerolineae bacterium]
MSKTLPVIGALILLLLLSPLAAHAGDVTPPSPVKPAGTVTLVVGGPGQQTDPHVSNNGISYSFVDVGEIHYVDLGSGTNTAIPHGAGVWDALSDTSGNTVVFNRNAVGDKRIMFTSIVNGAPGSVQELAPLPDSVIPLRQRASIGGSTVAFEEIYPGTNSLPEISLANLANPSAPAIRLTNDGYADRYPAVSPDGNVVAWVKSLETGSDIWQATRNPDGTWTPKQLTGLNGPDGNESFPDTDGQIVVYGSDRGGLNDIYWQPVGGGTETHIVMSGLQQNPSVSRGVIAFEGDPNSTGYNDIYAYDTHTNTLYQITDTATLLERLNDISVGADGTVRIVWAAPNAAGDLDIYAFSFQIGNTYKIQPLFDQAHSYKLGGVLPLKLQLLNADGTNVSSSALVLNATGLVQKDSSAAPLGVDSPGSANPDNNFRYDATLQGYIFNLSTKNLAAGTWQMQFKVSGDANTYIVQFDLR